MAFLELKNIKKFYDEVEVINNLSLKINDGEFCVLVEIFLLMILK